MIARMANVFANGRHHTHNNRATIAQQALHGLCGPRSRVNTAVLLSARRHIVRAPLATGANTLALVARCSSFRPAAGAVHWNQKAAFDQPLDFPPIVCRKFDQADRAVALGTTFIGRSHNARIVKRGLSSAIARISGRPFCLCLIGSNVYCP